MLGQYPQSEVAAAVRRVVEASETLPPVGAVVRAIRDARVTANRNMTSTVQDSMRIAGMVKEFRRANPEVSADDVAEFVSKLERQLAR